MLKTNKYFFSLLTLVVLSVFKPNSTNAQTTLTWKDFDKITFVEKWDTTYQATTHLPKFNNRLKALDGKPIIIEGYLLPIEISAGYYILKSNEKPISFGCGNQIGNNTDELIELKFIKVDSTYLKQFNNKKVTIKGILKLNDSDILQLNLIIESAEIVE
jgi:hypothetical protein